jgi:hypothetical protein
VDASVPLNDEAITCLVEKILLEQNEERPVERVRNMIGETTAASGVITPSTFPVTAG